MSRFFFQRQPSPLNEWWRYLLVIVLIVTGIIGFGGIPQLIALYVKGLTLEAAQSLPPEAFNNLFSSNELLTYNLFVFCIAFLMLLLGVRFLFRAKPKTLFTLRPDIDLKRFGVAFLLWLAIEGMLIAVDWMTGGLSGLRWNYDPEQFLLLLLICLFLVPIQTGAEELFCRGLILKWTGKATANGIAAALINGIIFGGLHWLNPEVNALGWFAVLFYVLSGVFAALITIMDDGIELSWGYHTANNFVGLLFISNDWGALPTEALWIDTAKPVIGWGLPVILFIGYPLLFVVLAKIYRWTDWKERLLGK